MIRKERADIVAALGPVDVACHEAAHAVIAFQLNIPIHRARLTHGGRAGRVSTNAPDRSFVPPGVEPSSPETARAFFEAALHEAIVDYAGHMAVVALLGNADLTDESVQACGASLDWQNAEARLYGDDQLTAYAQQEAVRLVVQHRKAIHKVAEALLEWGYLEAEQVRWLIESDEPMPENLTLLRRRRPARLRSAIAG